MKALVLGASGATGKLAVRQLAQRGIEVRALLREGASLGEEPIDLASVEVRRGSIAELDQAALAGLVEGCDAIVSCLGHNITLKGIYGAPRLLVRGAIQGCCEALRRGGGGKRKLVLMSTTASEDRELREARSAAERAILAALTLVLPPHRDNIAAATYLAEVVGRDDPAIEWVAVRPDGLVDAPSPSPSPYELYEAPRRSPLFDPGKTSRVNVAAFMAELLAKGELWETWKGRMPVIYDAGQAAGRDA
ncbi:MAG TPA: SDR family oxidoreductase [Spirochaetia bacterium]|nr:SDR family oxidoreductase [Spirochaetia bacterium]